MVYMLVHSNHQVKMRNTAFCFLVFFKCILATDNLMNSQEVNFTKHHDAEVKLKTQLLQNYSVDVLPPHNSTSPVIITIGLGLVLVKDLDAKTQTATAVHWIKLVWHDPRLQWNSSDYGGINVLRIAAERLWQPDIYLCNSANMNSISPVMKNVLKLLYPDGTVVWIPPATLSSLCEVDLKYYPYDTHNCSLKFGSWTHDGEHMDFALYDNDKTVGLAEAHTKGGEWEIVTTNAVRTIHKYACCNESYPALTFSVVLRRRSPFYIASIGSPLMVATFLQLIALWMSPLNHHRLVLNVAALFTSIVLLMHLASTLPAVGRNIPLVMHICGILTITNVLATIISITFKTIASPKRTDQAPQWITMILQNGILNALCIQTSKPMGNPIPRGESVNLFADDGQFNSSLTMSISNSWMFFCQMIDRIFFIACIIIIISIVIAATG